MKGRDNHTFWSKCSILGITIVGIGLNMVWKFDVMKYGRIFKNSF